MKQERRSRRGKRRRYQDKRWKNYIYVEGWWNRGRYYKRKKYRQRKKKWKKSHQILVGTADWLTTKWYKDIKANDERNGEQDQDSRPRDSVRERNQGNIAKHKAMLGSMKRIKNWQVKFRVMLVNVYFLIFLVAKAIPKSQQRLCWNAVFRRRFEQ